jgi:phosphatidylglycerophosphate synthase
MVLHSHTPFTWRSLFTVLAWPNNLVTLGRAAVVAALVVPMFAGWQWPTIPASAAFIIGLWLLDYLDGWLARRLARNSSFGESLDLAVDRCCELTVSAFLLANRPQYTVAVLVFLALRIAPEVLVARFAGLAPDMFATAIREAFPDRRHVDGRLVRLALEANSLSKVLFFCGALFWSIPAWTGILIAGPAVIFAGLTAAVMRAHASRVLTERGQ